MFQLGRTIVSEDIIEKDFVCNLAACKGVCCVEGDSGAPLEKQETERLESDYSKIKPYLRPEGIEAILNQGPFIKTDKDALETPLVNDKECAYVVFDDDQKALCGIEQAFNNGDIDWQKPISCHLYPVRVKEYSAFSALNYHRWPICDSACSLGGELQIPVYRFVKEALIRKFGPEWYEELEEVAKTMGSRT
ncbi:MAG: DUF3109 family protein [Flavobacteriaceae bacterium]|nr:DUF3109 family protein [Bacteroidia bacterium]NNF73763.1 DUF3109 family protein [Flavobacteriaceae bacterium]